LAEIAIALQTALERRRALGTPGRANARVLAQGDGWSVADVVCTSGPQDTPFEEEHSHYSIAIVLAGSFQYRSATGRALMTPGSVLLGNPGRCYECGHEHAEGDRCLSFWYAPHYFEPLVAEVGHRPIRDFAVPRIPPMRSLAATVALAAANVLAGEDAAWHEVGLQLAARAVHLSSGVTGTYRAPANAEARVTRTIRMIDERPETPLTLDTMGRIAGLSSYHFLRTFQRLTGITPHQYILRARLREAALQILTRRQPILDLAFDCGFGDVSNFNRAFRAEFGMSPRAFRRRGA